MVDGLVNLGSPVEDRIIILNILRGLNQRFEHVAFIIRCYSPFPNFLKVRDDLLLEEIHMDSTDPSVAPMALYTNIAPPAARPPSSTPSCPPSGGNSGTSGHRNKNNNKNRNGGHGSGNNDRNNKVVIALLVRPPPPLPLTAEPACHGRLTATRGRGT
jgi:hypothetical protein